ncbi:MAG TPA: Type 1 glutamine amidotransferase-like domain-containing protein [Thermoanaerobaculia bacterium]|jgi:cyanophycinase-like exopeptidase|nr:Type 1 glutamine amidotransferase-like domain-containing protein [Thermoanaerobaculia bacterium]
MKKSLTLSLATPVHLLTLIGGGEFSFGETRAIDELLLSRMPRDRRTIAFLPTASGSPEYATHIGKYFREIDPTVETINVPVYRGRDNRRQKNLNMIAAAGMIYLGGGVTNNLLSTLRESAAEIAMREAAQNGAVIAAIGAAASSFGTYAPDMRGGDALAGLGWIAHTAVDTAFNPEDDVALRRLMSLPEVDIGIGIPPKVALFIESDGTCEIVGDGRIAVFRKPSSGL